MDPVAPTGAYVPTPLVPIMFVLFLKSIYALYDSGDQGGNNDIINFGHRSNEVKLS